jgi:hypothetical protein
VSALAGIADQLLDPLKVDDGHHANQQSTWRATLCCGVTTPPCSPS